MPRTFTFCIKNILLLLMMCFGLPRASAQLSPGSIQTSHGKIGFYEFRPAGYNPDSSYHYPLIIFLHGVGERGNGTTDLPLVFAHALPKLLKNGASMQFVVNGQPHAFLVLMPQMTKDYINWQNFYIDEMMGYAKKNLNIDTNKIFLTGWSLGGGGAWKYATFSETNASRVAGILLAAASPDYTELCNLAKGKVAVWA
ncbi:MAG TPA: hypothetical protein VEZ17_13465, partial [Chitinophagaceae bacterium]|nr:hypothetical protein [Chitinophagaceae bacterium]